MKVIGRFSSSEKVKQLNNAANKAAAVTKKYIAEHFSNAMELHDRGRKLLHRAYKDPNVRVLELKESIAFLKCGLQTMKEDLAKVQAGIAAKKTPRLSGDAPVKEVKKVAPRKKKAAIRKK